MKGGARKGGRTKKAGQKHPQVNIAESPIAWLYSRRDKDGQPLISRAEYEAGERLRADFTFAQMGPRVTSRWSPPMGSGSHGCRGSAAELQDNVIAAGERVRRALSAVGPELAGVLIDVCCHLKGLEFKERQAGWPQRSGKVVLRIALKALARHYGLISDARLHERAVRVRHWGTEGYRPSIDGDAS